MDALTAGLAAIQLSRGHWQVAIIIVLVGTAIAVAGDRFTTASGNGSGEKRAAA